jgi:circadian clock protein KaiB
MKEKEPKDSSKEFEAAMRSAGSEKFVLRLYVSGSTAKSLAAIQSIRKICDEHLAGRCELEVVDIYQQPTLARGEQIIAVPTLIKKLPLPLRKFIGNLADEERIILGLDLKQKGKTRAETAENGGKAAKKTVVRNAQQGNSKGRDSKK